MLCIPRSQIEKLKSAFRSGDISLEKLYDMTDAERRTVFSEYLSTDMAKFLNGEFEKAMVSSNKKALENFVKKTFSPDQKDMRSTFTKKLEKFGETMKSFDENDFLQDLAGAKLGLKDITEEEVNHMIELKDTYEKKALEIDPSSPPRSQERLEYGAAFEMYKKYIADLKSEDLISTKENVKYKLTHPQEILYDIGNLSKSILSSLDDSFFGRQAIRELLSPFTGGTKRWVTNFAKSFGDIGKQLVSGIDLKNPLSTIRDSEGKVSLKGFFKEPNDAVLNAIKADVNSRPNALNGKYAAAQNGYGLGVHSEEAFPSNLAERVPLLGRLFKASEVAFNGGALRLRADLADALIERAEKQGVDVLNKKEADGIGKLTASLTGRGDIGKAAVAGREINALAFSIRFLKSNIESLLAPAKYLAGKTRGEEEGMFAKKQAALNTVQVIGSIAAIMTLANILQPGSAETDPRSANFGKIKIGSRAYDITGGMGSLVVLASRIVPTEHNGRWGFWFKDPRTGKYTQTGTGKFGEKTPLDLVESFMEGKLSPTAGVLRDLLKQKDYNGNVPTAGSIAQDLTVPLPIQTFEQLKDPASADGLLTMLAEEAGFSSSDISKKSKYKLKK